MVDQSQRCCGPSSGGQRAFLIPLVLCMEISHACIHGNSHKKTAEFIAPLVALAMHSQAAVEKTVCCKGGHQRQAWSSFNCSLSQCAESRRWSICSAPVTCEIKAGTSSVQSLKHICDSGRIATEVQQLNTIISHADCDFTSILRQKEHCGPI